MNVPGNVDRCEAGWLGSNVDGMHGHDAYICCRVGIGDG